MGGRGGGAPGNANRSEGTATPTASGDVFDVVRDAFMAARQTGSFQQLGTRAGGDVVFVADIRPALERAGFDTKEKQDAALYGLLSQRKIRVIGEDAMWTVSPRARAGALYVPSIGGNLELLAISGFGSFEN